MTKEILVFLKSSQVLKLKGTLLNFMDTLNIIKTQQSTIASEFIYWDDTIIFLNAIEAVMPFDDETPAKKRKHLTVVGENDGT